MSTIDYAKVGTGLYEPGDFQGGTRGLDLTQSGPRTENYATFGCQVPNVDPIDTPDWERARVYFERKTFTNGLWKFPDGKEVTHWGFEDRLRGRDQTPYPSPVIRLREGELAHVKLETRNGPHTIHHHGIEPTTMNDGVGHVSFETSGSYIYQWVPRSAGTWFYHCHRNTVLHFEMGLFGALIVDPPKGYGHPFVDAERTKYLYDTEMLWVADDVDPRWHDLNHSAGLCGDDVGLNVFRPKYFFVNGVHKPTFSDGRVALVAGKGQRVLVRLLNASYSILGVTIEGLNGEIISVDGHPLVSTPSKPKPWVKPRAVPSDREFFMSSAMRHDLWIDTSSAVERRYKVTFKYYDWITRQQHPGGIAETYIEVSRTAPAMPNIVR